MPALRWWIPLGFVLLLSCGDGGTAPAVSPVARVVVLGPGVPLAIGATIQLGLAAEDAAGRAVTGRTAAWNSLAPAVATVSPTGLVTALGAGTTTVSATIDGVTGQVVVTVLGEPNLTVARVWLTQGTQRPDGTVPLVAGGLPALVNVIGSVQPAFPKGRPMIRVRVYQGAEVTYEDIQPMNGTSAATPHDGAPLHQVVVPAQWIQPGIGVEVVANPDGSVPEATLEDNRWPVQDPARLIPIRTVAPLAVHLVPIHLTVGGTTGIVTPASLQEYLHSVRQMFPVAEVTATIGAAFSTDVNFGGGEPAAWLQILPQLDALRIIEGTSRYYVGAIRPPVGITFVQNGGWGYIPTNPLSTGSGTRTSLVVGVGWFNRAAATQELVAHELGHNHRRQHAPCGSPSSPDLAYPHPGGALGVWTHDVYSFAAGLRSTIVATAPQAGYDLMSYCVPVWTSDYSYAALLDVRSAQVAAPPSVPCACLVVWGTVSPSGIIVEPAFETRAHVALGQGGSHRLEALDGEGRVLFTEWFTPTAIDHAPGVRQFLLAVPSDRAAPAAVAAIRVVDAAGRVAVAPSGSAVTAPISARRIGAGAMELTWDASRTPAILARDPTSGRVMGIGKSGRLVVHTASPAVEVTVSHGAANSSVRLVVP